ncbi:hypothetical protein FisN_6Lh335 [Fistulifera solaris]|uniref:Uncharacterized protein n=1 Tax=Fistulifera solaris TaxID=1519565 RepID=A0A1Z5JKM5_FISSO|nr:hypothetical protein FisN_6Lh335 [Fistulifera solaris]|eukprot:GAX14557.1 hypothetical protein FisN_6Lh335 [Fistulifera solaris]
MTGPLEKPSAESASQQETDAEELISTALVYPQPLQAVSAALGVDVTVMSNFVPGANTGSEAFSRLVQGWENYMNDAKDQPIQMLQDLQLCGEGDLNLLTDGPSSFTQHLMQPELRHIRSSPLQWRPKVFDQEMDQEESNIMPPPIPLDPMQRSSSTPSSFRQNSMCTSIGTEGRSAFTLPSQRVNYTSSVTHPRRSAFDPVKYYAWQLEDMERTSIEVMDMTPDKEAQEASTPQRRGAASRAARFLEDVRVLSRRRRFGGKGKKGQNAKEKNGGDAKAESLAAPDTSITVITEPDYKSTLPMAPEDMYSPPIKDTEVADKEEEPYQRIEAQLQSESPNSSPIHPQVAEDHAENQQEQKQYEHSLRIKYSSVDQKLETLPSPSPTRMAAGDASETESPGTARSSVTGSSSGHATHAASIGSSMGASGLSTISETDREVMETNKEARRRVTGMNVAHTKNESDLASVHSSSTGSTATHCYLPVENSPVPLRDGANVPLDRFFTETALSTGQIITSFVRSQVSGMTRTQSGTTTSASTSESTTGTHTTASISSQEGPPPTIVSYLERLPELLSLRETVESSSTRATGKEGEEREDSPAEMGNLVFEVAKASIERKHKSSSPAISQCVRHDKFRARPPRSPYMIPRSASTPSPTSSPLIIHHSPPRNIVDKPEPILVSRPHVMRSGNFVHAHTFSLGRCMTAHEEEEEIIARRPKLSVITGSPGITTTDAINSDEMYHDESIEVLKSDSTDTMLTMPAMVTPEKTNP